MVTIRSRVPGTRLLACTAATLILLGPATAGSRAQSAPDGAAPAQTQAPEPEAATPTVDGKPVAWWIEQLGADDFATREKATATLAKAGKDALPLLEKAAHSPDPEVRWRAQKALASVRKRVAARPAETQPEPAEPAPGELPNPFAELQRALRTLPELGKAFDEENELDPLLPKEFQRMFEQLQRELFERALQPGSPDRSAARSHFMVLRFKDGKWVLEEVDGASTSRDPVGVDPLPLSPLVRAQLRIDGDAGFAIERVRPGGLASRAGLERFDVVIALDGNPVHDAAELEALGKPGTHTITVVRAGKRRTIEFRNGSAKPAPETPQKK